MRLAPEAREDRDHEQEHEPRAEREQHRGEGRQRHEGLGDAPQRAEEAEPARGLATRAIEVVVEGRILELRQVERRRVLHQPHRRLDREQVGELSVDEHRGAGEQLAKDDDADLEADQRQDGAPASSRALGLHDTVDDQLRDPERCDRHEAAHQAQRAHRDREAAMGLPHEARQLGTYLSAWSRSLKVEEPPALEMVVPVGSGVVRSWA